MLQHEENIKFQGFDTLAFPKSKAIFQIHFSNMPLNKPVVHPESYGFMLDHCYADVRQWVYTGRIAPNFQKFAWMFNTAGGLIRAWVHHNEAHRRLIKRHRWLMPDTATEKNRPLIHYVDYWDQMVLHAEADGNERRARLLN